jgi:predicted Zn-ribbon and HTH transcriptional regulator
MAINKRELIIYQCKRCLWTWPGRKETAPETCPKCRSPYWDKERQFNGADNCVVADERRTPQAD